MKVFQFIKKVPKLIKNNLVSLFIILAILILILHSCSCGQEGMIQSAVRKQDIPDGQEDLYILKSEIVPPVCPKCPSVIQNCPKQEKCRPCPPCGRCPEPQFTCKKVPNYNVRQTGEGVEPSPWRNNLSEFA